MLLDLAAAGDFATYTGRVAARISMVCAAYADQKRSPLRVASGDDERCEQLSTELLGRLPELCDHCDRFRALWGEEDAALARSEALIASGRVTIREYPDVDLAVVDVPKDVNLPGGHRFAHLWYPGLHPMAIANATGRFAVVTRQGLRYRFHYRYETWVQYRPRRPRARRDLRPLAAALSELEPAGLTWPAVPRAASCRTSSSNWSSPTWPAHPPTGTRIRTADTAGATRALHGPRQARPRPTPTCVSPAQANTDTRRYLYPGLGCPRCS